MWPRDPEVLLEDYEKLRYKIYKQELPRFAYLDEQTCKVVYNQAEADDLQSYIDYQFIKLVKEYDPTSGVDFPGYIKSKLPLRVKHSYIKRKYAHYYKTHALKEDNNKLAEETLYKQSLDTWATDAEQSDIIKMVEGLDLSPLEKDIVDVWLQPPIIRESSNRVPAYNSPKMVYMLLKSKYPEYSQTAFLNKIKKLRKKLQKKIEQES